MTWDNVLICGVNWLGDSIMSMPAIQPFKRQNPSCRITMLVKSKLVPIWAMHSALDDVIELRGNSVGTLTTAGVVKNHGFDRAFVFANSFRSVLIPFLARVPVRTGMPGHQRIWMLTHVIRPCAGVDSRHQSWEYADILGLGDDCGKLDIPCLSVPQTVVEKSRECAGGIKGENWVGLIPGAAYGPSKCWPAEHFIEAGRSLVRRGKFGIIVFGTEDEKDLCSKVAEGIGDGALNLAGKTSLPELAALLGLCRVVITNDSGGMHLAAAVGTKVVAIFGLTDPARTGPLGSGHRIMLKEGIRRSRDIKRDSPEAREWLRSIGPEKVVQAAIELLG